MNRFNKYKLTLSQNGRYPHFEYYQTLEQCYKEVSLFIDDLSIVYKNSGYKKEGDIRRDKAVYYTHPAFGCDSALTIEVNQ